MGSSVVAAQTRPRVPREALYQTPAVAWPTIVLFVMALLAWGVVVWAAQTAIIPVWLAVVLNSAIAFVQFTVLHDGVHRSLMRGHPWLNDFVAGLAAAFLGPIATVAAFRYAHFKHHRTTNDHGEVPDPDLWSGEGPRWRLPLQWATADFSYAVVILRDWSGIALRERVKMVSVSLFILALYAVLWRVGLGWEATIYWLLPSRFAIAYLAFAFNFLPHYPHKVPQSHNPYAATNVRRGGEPVMHWLFLYQNYHLIHHLFPSVPFYNYRKIWDQRRDEFIAKGAPVVPLFALSPAADLKDYSIQTHE